MSVAVAVVVVAVHVVVVAVDDGLSSKILDVVADLVQLHNHWL